MVHNLGANLLKWSLLRGRRVVFFYTWFMILIDTSEQLMSQRHWIEPPGGSSSDTLQAYRDQ